jgi:hypothetical protein
MNSTTPAYPNCIDTPSTLIHPSSSDTIVPKDAAPTIRSAANDPSLWRSILDTHGKAILKWASHQFLDLATAVPLETINARDLVNLLAKTGRLGYTETDVVEDETIVPRIHEADKGTQPSLSANSASTLPGVRTG